MVNSNFYALDTLKRISTSIQAARAANLCTACFHYRKNLVDENLKANMLQDKIPLCSRQYERQFNTTRVPGLISDKLVHYSDSKHIAVYCKGKWFKLYTYFQSVPLNAKELEGQIQKIIDGADDEVGSDCEKYLGSLTAGDRVPWAQAREKYFARGVNKSSLSAIEKAAFVLVLDDEEYDYIPSDGRTLDSFARAILHGKGYNRWFDKSFTMVVTKNGRSGLNVEHSWADAPVTGHMWESCVTNEVLFVGYDSEGHSRGTLRFLDLPDPIKLKWDFNAKIEAHVMTSFKQANELLNDVDLHIMIHDSFGKGFIKTCKTSPDAFIQMALQLAYFRDIGKHHLTYEASMTRLFREGRTETVRSCSIESCQFVASMCSGSDDKKEQKRLFNVACDYHQTQYRDAMTGNGVDRHIFCLYVVSKYLELDLPFLKEILGEPWRLSTSQSPATQTDLVDLRKHPEFISAGGGFGPVADDGYGISYIITGEDTIFFHISSKKSCGTTDSYRFGSAIRQAMQDIKGLFGKS
jgi:carnitine O-palmitoyltransferase 1